MWPIGIYRCASVEQVCGDFARVEDDDWLTGCIQVDEIAWTEIGCASERAKSGW
jgi:hypothetical protein